MGLTQERIAELIGTVDPSGITVTAQRGPHHIVTCASGRTHLVRLADDPHWLRRERWGYETMHSLGIPCPEVELWVEPREDLPSGCLIVQWLSALVEPAEVFDSEGKCAHTLQLCRALGEALRRLHSAEVVGAIPDFVPHSDRASALSYGTSKARQLREAGLVDEAFERNFVRLVEQCTARIPDPHPPTLCFQDMHFRNILVTNRAQAQVAAFVDVGETVVGWPYWDFTNWERWELLYGHPWVRKPVLEAYGELDMVLYHFAVLVRFSESHDLFKGAIGKQIRLAVETGDPMAFDLVQLRCER